MGTIKILLIELKQSEIYILQKYQSHQIYWINKSWRTLTFSDIFMSHSY